MGTWPRSGKRPNQKEGRNIHRPRFPEPYFFLLPLFAPPTFYDPAFSLPTFRSLLFRSLLFRPLLFSPPTFFRSCHPTPKLTLIAQEIYETAGKATYEKKRNRRDADAKRGRG